MVGFGRRARRWLLIVLVVAPLLGGTGKVLVDGERELRRIDCDRLWRDYQREYSGGGELGFSGRLVAPQC